MHTYHAYAAPSAKAPLEPFNFDPVPLGPEEVEIEVSHCGLCHSDLSMLDNDWGMSKYPFVPGHEVTGTVSALGEQAKGLKTGQRVGLGWWSHSCLSCRQCLSGDHNLCPTAQGTIVGRHGGFADRVRAQWTWVLIGRGRALEVLLGADDIPGDLAELYGYVNRALPDAELDGFVQALATRIATFDKDAIRETKRLVDVASLPPDAEIAPEWDAFIASVKRPASQERISKLMQQGFHKPGDVETRLGHYVGQLGRRDLRI